MLTRTVITRTSVTLLKLLLHEEYRRRSIIPYYSRNSVKQVWPAEVSAVSQVHLLLMGTGMFTE